MKKTRVGAYGLISEGSRLLLCRINLPGKPEHGLWTLPGGLDFGELPAAGMMREVAEETGYVVEPTSLAHADSWIGPCDGVACHHVRILYHARIVGGALQHERAGSTDCCQWCDQDDPPPLGDLAAIGFRLVFGE